MDSHSKCLECAHWARDLDPLIGRCQVFDEWRAQLEGHDQYGDCPHYVFGEFRKRYSWIKAEVS